MYTKIKTKNEIESMRVSGGMLATVLSYLEREIQVNLSTSDVARMAKKELQKLGGQPAFLGYQGFPDVICVSVNDEVVHGIPRADKIIKDGDIVSVDFGVVYQGMITDSALSIIAGKPKKPSHQKLVETTRLSLDVGISVLKDNVSVGDIGNAIESVLAPAGYGIIRDLVGHGVGHSLHEDPNIANYGKKNKGPKLSAGMTIAIEPMATLGKENISLDEDGWTIRTADNSLAAHFEHTILITADGYEVLTLRK